MVDEEKQRLEATRAALVSALSGMPDILFHYCPSDSFVSIVSTRTVRLSALSLSNDSREGRLVSETLMRVADRDGLSNANGIIGLGSMIGFQSKLRSSLEFLERLFDGLGFCLSADGDLLSQWRGYADDGRGVSIGFHRSYWEKLSAKLRESDEWGFTLNKVIYEPTEHEELVKPTYTELRKLIDQGAFETTGRRTLLDSRSDEDIAADDKRIEASYRELMFKILGLFPMLYKLKSDAFKEEKEWRLVAAHYTENDETLGYRARGTSVIPFRDVAMSDIEGESSITEIILGPRHITPPAVIKAMLKQHGFGDIQVTKSRASYR